jgi:hypothetical protein
VTERLDADEKTAVALALAFHRVDLDGAAAILNTVDPHVLLSALLSFVNGEGTKSSGLLRDEFGKPVKDADGRNVIDLARGRAEWEQRLLEFLADQQAPA